MKAAAAARPTHAVPPPPAAATCGKVATAVPTLERRSSVTSGRFLTVESRRRNAPTDESYPQPARRVPGANPPQLDRHRLDPKLEVVGLNRGGEACGSCIRVEC